MIAHLEDKRFSPRVVLTNREDVTTGGGAAFSEYVTLVNYDKM